MANQEHVDILRQGVEVWNKWRGVYRLRPDLSDTNLIDINLTDANLSEVNFLRANLSNALLTGANLSIANLNEADLRRSVLHDANLSTTSLFGADLCEASLFWANLRGAKLRETDLSRARVAFTLFGDLDLHAAKGLETIEHHGPSTIGTDTILKSKGNIPKSFLRGAGLDDTFIAYVLSLAKKPTQFYTCFISYSSQDLEFAQRLYNDLQENGVRCWYAPEDLKIGDHYHQRIDKSIRLYDKLVLILSEQAVQSAWVEREVVAARKKEDREQRPVLFPLCLDDAVMCTRQKPGPLIYAVGGTSATLPNGNTTMSISKSLSGCYMISN